MNDIRSYPKNGLIVRNTLRFSWRLGGLAGEMLVSRKAGKLQRKL
jgi:hypothetical protein